MNPNYALPETEVIEKMLGKSKVLLMPNKTALTVYVAVGFKVGSGDEDMETMGSAHFLEHFLFKGSRDFKAPRQSKQAIEKIGGRSNASTSEEVTKYHAIFPIFPPGGAKIAFHALGQIVCNPLFPEREFNLEQNVILEEIGMYDDFHSHKCYHQARSLLFKNHSLGESISGTQDSVKKISLSHLMDFYQSYYTQENAAIVVSGNFDVDEIMGLLEKHVVLPVKNRTPHVSRPSPIEKNEVVLLMRNTQQENVMMMSNAPGRDDKEWAKMRVFADALGGRASSPLFTEIREKRGLAYSVDSSIASFGEVGAFLVDMGCSAKSVDLATKVVFREIEKIAKSYTLKQLNHGRKSMIGNILMSLDGTHGFADAHLGSYLKRGKIVSAQDMISDLCAVSEQDVMKAAQTVLEQPWVFSGVGPLPDSAQVCERLKSLLPAKSPINTK